MLHLKSEREIRLMRQAGLVVWRAHDLVRQEITVGMTTAQLDAKVAEYFTQTGATPLFLNYPNASQDKPPFPAVICTSVNDEVVHGIPGDRQLQAGDIVSVDIGVKLDGWCGDAACTYAVGQLAPEVEKLLNVTRETLELAVGLMNEKGMWSEVAREMSSYVHDHGFSVVECFVGHGIGRQLHEDPQVPNFLSRSLRGTGDFRIETGLVIAVEPMVNMGIKGVKMAPDHWTQMTIDGLPSAHFEHTIAVRQDGPFLLTQAPPIGRSGGASRLDPQNLQKMLFLGVLGGLPSWDPTTYTQAFTVTSPGLFPDPVSVGCGLTAPE